MTGPNADGLSNQLLTRMVLRVPRPDDLACFRQQFNDSMSESSGCEALEHMQHAITTEDRRECASAAIRAVLLK